MTTTMTDDGLAKSVAGKIARLVADRDLDGLRAVYTPDACIWHSSDDKEKTVEESLEFLAAQLSLTTKLWFEDQRVTPTPSGYVDQHYVCAVLTTGDEVRIPIVFVVTLEGERLKRLDDYATFAPLAPAIAAQSEGA